MLVSKSEAIIKAVDKGWGAMAMRGGIELLLTQLRAMANEAAKKALIKAGQKELEAGIFRDLCEAIGRRLAKNSIKKAVPYISAAIGALIDTSQMNKILEFANIFYHKRFILEKEDRIHVLMDKKNTVFYNSNI